MQITQEIGKSDAKVDKNVEKDTKTIKTEGKTMEKAPKSLEEQAKDMRADGTMKEQIEKFKGKGKKNKAVKPKTEEVTTMDIPKWRSDAEKILTDVCKKNGFAAPHRLNARANAKSGLGALHARSKEGHNKVSVAAHLLLLHVPPKVVGLPDTYKQNDKYAWVTVLNKVPASDLPKIFLKALKDPHSREHWMSETGCTPKGATVDLAAQKAALEAKLAAVTKRLKEEAKSSPKAKVTKKTAKPKATASPAIEKVAAEVA
jgi:hypothetical protein